VLIFPDLFKVPCNLQLNPFNLPILPSNVAEETPSLPLEAPAKFNSPFIPEESLNARGSTKTTPAIAFAPYRIPSAPFITLNLPAI